MRPQLTPPLRAVVVGVGFTAASSIVATALAVAPAGTIVSVVPTPGLEGTTVVPPETTTTTTTTVAPAPAPATAVPPVAALAAAPSSGNAPLDVTLDGSGSHPGRPGGALGPWTLEFGDGASATGDGPLPSPTAVHVYDRPGAYTAKLTVSDPGCQTVLSSLPRINRAAVAPPANDGCTATATATVTVNAPPPAAVLTGIPLSGTAPHGVRFDGSASHTNQPGSSIASWRLDFGDTTSTGAAGPPPAPTASHAYLDPGTFPVTLTVVDANGTSAAATVPVTVSPAPPPPTAPTTTSTTSTTAPPRRVVDQPTTSSSTTSTTSTTATTSPAPTRPPATTLPPPPTTARPPAPIDLATTTTTTAPPILEVAATPAGPQPGLPAAAEPPAPTPPSTPPPTVAEPVVDLAKANAVEEGTSAVLVLLVVLMVGAGYIDMTLRTREERP